MRYTGKLEIGRPQYQAGHFIVPMVYVNHHATINDDDIKSCGLAVRQQFLQLLHLNKFTKYGPPEVKVERVSSHMLHIVVDSLAERGNQQRPIVIESLRPDEG